MGRSYTLQDYLLDVMNVEEEKPEREPFDPGKIVLRKWPMEENMFVSQDLLEGSGK